MSVRRFSYTLAALAACQGDPAPAAPVSRPSIEVFVGNKTVAKVIPGHPCRATVDGVDLQVGGPPLIATIGNVRWTAESGENGTTFRKNDEPVARIHANQLFDAQGIPLVKIADDGSIANGPGRVVRKATVVAGYAPKVEIKTMIKQPGTTQETAEATVTNTDDIVLASLLAAPEADPTLRGLVACHLLQAKGT